jgi:hypothetical protein
MTDVFDRARNWLGSFGRRPLLLSSPYPVAECLQRLAAVTSSRGPTTWYLSSRTALLPAPLFKGELHQSRIRLRRFAGAGSQNTFLAMLEVSLDQQADGGTALSGWIGLPAGVFRATLFVAVGFVVSLSFLATGVVQLALGHLIGLVPAVVFPLPAAGIIGFFAIGRRSLEPDIAELAREVSEVLGATEVAGPRL